LISINNSHNMSLFRCVGKYSQTHFSHSENIPECSPPLLRCFFETIQLCQYSSSGEHQIQFTDQQHIPISRKGVILRSTTGAIILMNTRHTELLKSRIKCRAWDQDNDFPYIHWSLGYLSNMFSHWTHECGLGKWVYCKNHSCTPNHGQKI
jgi:hypothetical protein